MHVINIVVVALLIWLEVVLCIGKLGGKHTLSCFLGRLRHYLAQFQDVLLLHDDSFVGVLISPDSLGLARVYIGRSCHYDSRFFP